MSKQKESKRRSPSIIARLMGLDYVLPPQSSSHRQTKSVENQQGRSGGGCSFGRSSKDEQKFKDVFEVSDAKKTESNRNLYHQGKVNDNLTQAEMDFIRQKFMEAKRLSTDEKLRHSKEFNEALEALDSNKDLLLKFLQHDIQGIPHKPQYTQAPLLKSANSQRFVNSLKTQKVDRELLRKSQRSPHRHGDDGSGYSSRSHSRQVSYGKVDLSNELQATKIVVLKPNIGEPHYSGRTFASPSSPTDEFRAYHRLPCTSIHGRQKSNEAIHIPRQNSRDSREISKVMSKQKKPSCFNGNGMSFETSGFRGYAGDESSSGSDSTSESELVPVTRTTFNRKNYRRSLSSISSVSREANRRLSERWKLTHKYEQGIEITRSGTLAEMLATSDREARPASFNGLNLRMTLVKDLRTMFSGLSFQNQLELAVGMVGTDPGQEIFQNPKLS